MTLPIVRIIAIVASIAAFLIILVRTRRMSRDEAKAAARIVLEDDIDG